MKTEQMLNKIISKYHGKLYNCLYPPNDYPWGTSRKNLNNTLKLINKILIEIPSEAWPKGKEYEMDYICDQWTVKLTIDNDGKRQADFQHSTDDHTAWVVENNKGKFINYDIGGS